MPPTPKEASLPFLDDANQAVQDAQGRPMMRPAGLDPHVFVNQGALDKRYYEMLLKYSYLDSSGAGLTILEHEASELAKFRQGGEWDAQRIGGHFHAEFVDYATVAIGLYASSSGMTRNEILGIQDRYAAMHSRYPAGTLMDQTYTHLPARNVANTEAGFKLIETGRIKPTVS